MRYRVSLVTICPQVLLAAALLALAGCSTASSSVRPAEGARAPVEEKTIVELDMIEGRGNGSTSRQQGSPDSFAAEFEEAERRFGEGDYEKAANGFLALADRVPDHDLAPAACSNAAAAFEQLEKYDRAVELYERLRRQYPESGLAPRATYRLGVNAERFFEYDAAIDQYMEFTRKTQGDPPDVLQQMGFRYTEKRPRAFVSTAVLAAALQRHRKAATRYERFAEQYPDHEDAASSQWNAAEMWKKAGEPKKMVAALRCYRETFADDSDRKARILEAMSRIADFHIERENWRKARDAYRRVVETFDEREFEPGSEAAHYAAKARFRLAERQFRDWQCIRIEGSLTEQRKKLDEKIEEQKRLAEAYKEVWDYKNLEYTLAAGFRLANLYDEMARDLYSVPIPFEEGTEKHEMYATKLEEIAKSLEKKAIESYEEAYQRAREEKVVNEWTRSVRRRLHEHDPEKYPLYRDSKLATRWRLPTDDADGETAELDAELRRGEYEPVFEKAKKRLRQDPGDVEAMVAMARATFRAGRHAFADMIVERAAERAPERADVYYLFGAIAVEAGDTGRAVANFEKALEHRPDFPEAHEGLGRVYYREGDFSGAATQFEKALEDRPEFLRARLNLGSAYKRMEQFEKAREQFERVLERDEESEQAHFNLGVLYLDADLPEMDDDRRLAKAVEKFETYERLAGDERCECLSQYLDTARKARAEKE